MCGSKIRNENDWNVCLCEKNKKGESQIISHVFYIHIGVLHEVFITPDLR